jgi:hypothetical protein
MAHAAPSPCPRSAHNVFNLVVRCRYHKFLPMAPSFWLSCSGSHSHAPLLFSFPSPVPTNPRGWPAGRGRGTSEGGAEGVSVYRRSRSALCTQSNWILMDCSPCWPCCIVARSWPCAHPAHGAGLLWVALPQTFFIPSYLTACSVRHATASPPHALWMGSYAGGPCLIGHVPKCISFV